jgi:hypothetical protein
MTWYQPGLPEARWPGEVPGEVIVSNRFLASIPAPP